jgi:hypothetical protein
VQGHRRVVRAVGAVTAAGMAVEILVIGGQAARGVASHFNVTSPLNAALFAVMGVAILVVWLAGFVALGLLVRQRFADRALGLALRLGLLISLLGAGLGGLMTQPTRAQREGLAAGQQVKAVGAHGVGAPEDGPGLPGVGWSTQGGDLRVPHFLGLHAMQVLPLLALWLKRRRERLALMGSASLGYLGLVAVLTLQALRGEPLLQLGAETLVSLGVLAAVTVTSALVGAGVARRRGEGRGPDSLRPVHP